MRHDHLSTNTPGFLTGTEMPIFGWWGGRLAHGDRVHRFSTAGDRALLRQQRPQRVSLSQCNNWRSDASATGPGCVKSPINLSDHVPELAKMLECQYVHRGRKIQPLRNERQVWPQGQSRQNQALIPGSSTEGWANSKSRSSSTKASRPPACRRLFWSHIRHPIASSSMYNAAQPRWHQDGAKRSGRSG